MKKGEESLMKHYQTAWSWLGRGMKIELGFGKVNKPDLTSTHLIYQPGFSISGKRKAFTDFETAFTPSQSFYQSSSVPNQLS